MKKLLILTAIFLNSCGRYEPPHQIDAYYSSLIERFKDDASAHNLSIGDFDNITVMTFDDNQDASSISECQYVSKENVKLQHIFYKEISFRSEVKNYPKNAQYQLFLHEVGHCAYHLQHVEAYQIMQPIYFDDARKNQSNWYLSSQP